MKKMKKYLLMLTALVCLWSCETDNKYIDVTVMPPATTEGLNTFGCLVDGWVYVGGRFYAKDWYPNGLPANPWPSNSFVYDEKKNELKVRVFVSEHERIEFTLVSPAEGKECPLTNAHFGDEQLDDGKAFIHRFGTRSGIVSATFSNGNRLTKGRLDVHFYTAGRQEEP